MKLNEKKIKTNVVLVNQIRDVDRILSVFHITLFDKLLFIITSLSLNIGFLGGCVKLYI